MGAAAETLRPVCGASGCRAGASVELPFCRAHWRALPPESRRAIIRQWRIGYGTGELAASFQTADAVRGARRLLAEAEMATRSARAIEAASADLLRRAERAAGLSDLEEGGAYNINYLMKDFSLSHGDSFGDEALP